MKRWLPQQTYTLIFVSAMLAGICGAFALQQALDFDLDSRIKVLHQSRKSVMLDALKAYQNNLSALADHPAVMTYLQQHPGREDFKVLDPFDLQRLSEEVTGAFTANYLEKNEGGAELDLLYKHMIKYPAWAAKALLDGPSDTWRQVSRLVKLGGLQDVTLVDAHSHRIVFTDRKRYDLGADLTDQLMNETDMGRLYTEVMQHPHNQRFTDLLQHKPFINEPIISISFPVWNQRRKIEGVLVGHISMHQIDRWLHSNGQWSQLGYRPNEQTYLVNSKGILRSQWRPFGEFRDEFVQTMAMVSGHEPAARLLNRSSAGGLIKVADEKLLHRLQQNEIGGNNAIEELDYKWAIIERMPLEGLDWYLVSETNREQLNWQRIALTSLIALFGFGLIIQLHRRNEHLKLELEKGILDHKNQLSEMEAKNIQVRELIALLQQTDNSLKNLKRHYVSQRAHYLSFLANLQKEARTFRELFKRERAESERLRSLNIQITASMRRQSTNLLTQNMKMQLADHNLKSHAKKPVPTGK